MNEELYNEKIKVINHRLDAFAIEQQEMKKEINHRLDAYAIEQKEMKEEIRENADLKYTLQNLSTVVNELKVTVNELNSKDAKTWNNIKWLVLSGIITALLGFFLGQVFHI